MTTAMKYTLPERTRYYFQAPDTGHCCYLEYHRMTGVARLLVWDAHDPHELGPGPAWTKDDLDLARRLCAPHYISQDDVEAALRGLDIDWSADNR